MPGTARLITDGASCPFWVRGDGGEPARYRQRQPQARGPSSPVTCLSNRSRTRPAACCTAAFLTLSSPAVPPAHSW